ncbi:MAG: nuclear transport factor 2 family protein [Gaiella sp.]|nr:nuclear transport factor 2 family protein [Gaiella sp.]
MGDTAVVEELLAAIRDRDLDRIAACFAPGARLRALTPRELRVENGPEEILARYRGWLALDAFVVTDGDVVPIADRVRLRYRFHGRDPVKGWQENEHTAYAVVVDGRIAALNLSCAGFRPAEPPD